MTGTPATGRQIANGAAWMMGFKLLDKSIGLISTLILARVLTPADFGLVAMAMAVVAMLELMGAFGFESALIQRQNTDASHFNTAWTFNVIFGVGIATMLLIMAIPAASFYREPRLELMLPALAIGALIGGFENIGTVIFRKEMDFGKEFKFLLAKRFTGFIVTITLALIFRSFWALIAGTVTGKLMSVFISYRLHPYRPRFSLAARADLLHFSKWIFISNLIQFLHSRSTDFVLGRTVGSHGLGVYTIASEIAAMPSTELIAPLNRAVYPAYARLASDRDQLMVRFLEVFGIISLLAFPVAVGLYFLSDLVVGLLLGDKWIEAIPIMQIAGLSGLLAALQGNLYLVIVAMGKPKANTLLSAALLMVSLPAIIYASYQFGVLGAAYAHFVAALLGFIGIVIVFTHITGLHKKRLFSVMWRPLLSASAMGFTLVYARTLQVDFVPALPLTLQLAALVIIGATSYALSTLLIWTLAGKPESAEHIFLKVVLKKVRWTFSAKTNKL
jgi:lipopolysaccharide exporter